MAPRDTCPYCGTRFARPLDGDVYTGSEQGDHHGDMTLVGLKGDEELRFFVYSCPKCCSRTIDVHMHPFRKPEGTQVTTVRPLAGERPVPREVPEALAGDYREATRIADLSLKGATTLARRCLQATLRYVFADLPRGELFREIRWLEENDRLSAELITPLHALRKAGNFGAIREGTD